MKNFYLVAAATALFAFVGCQEENAKTASGTKVDTTKVSALDADICGKCGCCAGCEDCCSADAEKCSCGFNKGSQLCCAEGLKPSDVTYCKKCGHEKGGESCCVEGAEKCTKCGLAKGSPICCKVNDKKEDGSMEDDHGHDDMDSDAEMDKSEDAG